MSRADDIRAQVLKITAQISQTLTRTGRSPDSLTLLAVSKKQPVEDIMEAHKAGLRHFGENYVQEFIAKQDILSQQPIVWHMIGHLQRRKIADVVGKAALIHSLDSYPLAWEIEKQASRKNLVQDCLIQVNLGGEASKSGVAPQDFFNLTKELCALKAVRIKGLMCIPPALPKEEVRPYFVELRNLLKKVNEQKLYREPWTELSMGMTLDFDVAIEEGSTIVRIGTAIFGERN